MTSQEMPDFVALYEQAIKATRGYVAGVGEKHWDGATPCAEWNLRALLSHVVWGGNMAKAVMERQRPGSAGGDLLGSDALAAYDTANAGAIEAAKANNAMDMANMVRAPWGEMPAPYFIFSMFQDVLIHGWDIAKATGQDAMLPPELVETNYMVTLPMKDQFRGSGTYGEAEVEVSGSASTQTKLLGMLGRDAEWSLPS